ncbi:hypothetical protein PHYPSEUDO_005080 [Phytophthora pseudosyringae]|uniref:Secreted protein n=1 Tax=Phytophthora pseudosyringae TaxID=221518 RepID=A0A8T1VLX7_9STRA|nr:hypothetical protein PHYPSEUDO_005080 [Phytophthora pseudosyringae]
MWLPTPYTPPFLLVLIRYTCVLWTVAGTERITEPQVRGPAKNKLQEHVYETNTGWKGGVFGVGNRMNMSFVRGRGAGRRSRI